MSEALQYPPSTMTRQEFLAWADQQPERHELVAGHVIQMARERAVHNDIKYFAWTALRRAIAEARVPCHVKGDGIAVEARDDAWYLPDAMVYCGEPIAPEATTVKEPVIVVEVTSPSSGNIDGTYKFIDYFSIPTVQHYLIVSPSQRIVAHHRRMEETSFVTRLVGTGPIALDPPGITIQVEELFA
jgi:Uma2 family endonuclease